MPNVIKPPNFSEGQDANNWILLYESTTRLNEWGDLQKLLYVCNCFGDEVKNWVLPHTVEPDSTWTTFKAAFLKKFQVKVSLFSLLQQVINFRMKNNESSQDYIDRFAKLKKTYDDEVKRRDTETQARNDSLASLARNNSIVNRSENSRFPTSPNVNNDESREQETTNNAVPTASLIQPDSFSAEMGLTETMFIKAFVHGIVPEYYRLAIMNNHPLSLLHAYELLKLYKDDDDFFTDVSTERQDVFVTPPDAHQKKEMSKLSKEVSDLSKDMSAVTLALKEMKEMLTSKNASTSYDKSKGPRCYNCNTTGHFGKDCSQPCKICKEQHIYYECPQYSKNKPKKESEHMMMELLTTFDHFAIGEKRELSTFNHVNHEHKQKKQATLSNKLKMVTRSQTANRVPLPESVRAVKKQPLYVQSKPMQAVEKLPVSIQPELIQNANVQPIEITPRPVPAIITQPDPFPPESNITMIIDPINIEHDNVIAPEMKLTVDAATQVMNDTPLITTRTTDKCSLCGTNKTTSPRHEENNIDLQELLHDPVFLFSIAQIAEMSPSLRTMLKKGLTKPHKKKKTDVNLYDYGVQAIIDTEIKNSAHTSGSAPRIQGSVNNVPCEIILDGGCAPCIISKQFAEKLNLLDQIEPVDRCLSLGDGRSLEPVGIVKNLRVNVGNTIISNFDALCLDVGKKYSFLIGRHGFHNIKMVTDWDFHNWVIKSEEGSIDLPVYYERQSSSVLTTPIVPIVSTLKNVTVHDNELDSGTTDDECEIVDFVIL